MIAADTSAAMAILLDEDHGPSFYHAMLNDGQVPVSPAAAVELLTVAMGRGDAVYQAAVDFLAMPFIRLVPPDEAQLWAAANACRRVPLLFTGNDFGLTDLMPAAL